MRQQKLGPEKRTRANPVRGQTAEYRVWITRYGGRAPENLAQVPADALALEPAEGGTMSAHEATRYVAAFNRAALARRRKLWAVALPVKVRYEGDPRPGEELAGRMGLVELSQRGAGRDKLEGA